MSEPQCAGELYTWLSTDRITMMDRNIPYLALVFSALPDRLISENVLPFDLNKLRPTMREIPN